MSQYTNLFVPPFRTEEEEAEEKAKRETLNENFDGLWKFRGSDSATKAAAVSMRGTLTMLFNKCRKDVGKTILPLAHGDPSIYPSFRTSVEAEDAVVHAVRSGAANSYTPGPGILPARRAVAEHLNGDLPHKLKAEDIYLTSGCSQGIETMIQVLARPNANILLPPLSYPHYYTRAVYSLLEIRRFNLLPDKEWEIDFESIEALADENTSAIVIMNPNNPCGNVYTYDHLKKVAETAKKLGIMVISDEVYKETIYGDNPFVPMGRFASIAPVVTLGSISKAWVVPGWRLGWIAIHDPHLLLHATQVVQSIKQLLDISPDPSSILQMALPKILEKTKKEFFVTKNEMLKQNVELAYERLRDIPFMVCPMKPEACTYLLTKLELRLMEDIIDDVDFCNKLASEENLVLLPGVTLGQKNWVRISIGVERWMLEDALERLKAFYGRHSKN